MTPEQWTLLLRYAHEGSSASIATITSFMEATQPDEHAKRVFTRLRRRLEDPEQYPTVPSVRRAAHSWELYLDEEGRTDEADRIHAIVSNNSW
jgi:hypothetical protein